MHMSVTQTITLEVLFILKSLAYVNAGAPPRCSVFVGNNIHKDSIVFHVLIQYLGFLVGRDLVKEKHSLQQSKHVRDPLTYLRRLLKMLVALMTVPVRVIWTVDDATMSL